MRLGELVSTSRQVAETRSRRSKVERLAELLRHLSPAEVPVAVAFRFRPALTGAASAATVVAYVLQAFAHPAGRRPEGEKFIAIQVGFLVWLGLAAVLLSAVLWRRTSRRKSENATAVGGGPPARKAKTAPTEKPIARTVVAIQTSRAGGNLLADMVLS